MKDVAKILLSDDDFNMLVLTRGDTHPLFAGHPDLSGGEVEEGEDAKTAVIREVDEETGLAVSPDTVKLVYQRNSDNRQHLVYRGNVNGTKPTPTISWEHSGYTWMTTEQLLSKKIPEGADPYYLSMLEYLRSEG